MQGRGVDHLELGTLKRLVGAHPLDYPDSGDGETQEGNAQSVGTCLGDVHT